jgi:hypothetical protein
MEWKGGGEEERKVRTNLAFCKHCTTSEGNASETWRLVVPAEAS